MLLTLFHLSCAATVRQGPGPNPWRVPERQVLSSWVWSARLHPHAVPYRVALTRFTLACCAKWCKYSISILVFSPDLVLTYSVHRSKSRLMINAEWLWTALLSFPHLQMFAGADWAPARSPPDLDSAHRALSIMPFSCVVHWDCARGRLWSSAAWVWVWLLPVWPYVSYLAGLCLSFPIHEMGMRIVPAP